MNYIEAKLLPVPCSEEACDVLASVLAPLGFDSFSNETAESGEVVSLLAYIPENLWDSEALTETLNQLPLPGVEVSWVANVVEMQDWNQEWEQSQQFEPIVITGSDESEALCCVHSPATPAEKVPACRYEIIIDPRMSFGSGTHETTSQLLEEIMAMRNEGLGMRNEELGVRNEELGVRNEELRALDMGTGTGVLGILCAQLGYQVRAIEIDDWVAANAIDNVLYNGLAGKVLVECGDAALLTEGPTYDLVLANINRNILVNDMPAYVSVMRPGATLMMSGFYEEDVPIIRERAESLGLTFKAMRSRNNWTVLKFVK